MSRLLARTLAVGGALLIAVLAFLPLANWMDGGHEAAWYGDVSGSWTTGTLLAVGGGVVLAIISARLPWLWREGSFSGLSLAARANPWIAGIVLALLALAAYATAAHLVFDRRPLLIDELAQLIQARNFASGDLWRPASSLPEFFSTMHVVEHQGRLFAQFPPGGPAMLALGELVNAAWLVVPVSGAIAVAAFTMYLRVAEPRATVAFGAALLFAFAPFTVFMAGSHMNHMTSLMWILIGIAALAHVMRADVPQPALALLSGLGFGAAATIRPLDAAAFALPAGIWFCVRTVRNRARWSELIAAGVGVAIPAAAMLWVNARTTGSPLVFGYELLWGKDVGLGFHTAPWGVAHTPARGVELLNLYFLRLQSYLFETPFPSLVPAIIAFALTRHVNAIDRYLLTSSALLTGIYFTYWHDGFYLGPRFVFALTPVLALWTARLPAFVRERAGDGTGYRTVVFGYGVAALIAIFALVPMRGRQYSQGLATMRWNADSAARASGVRGALVFVRESWGAQIVARLWGLGVTRPQTELLYRKVDTCLLEEGVSHVERRGLEGEAAFQALRPLLRDSLRVVQTKFSPDGSQRYLPSARYTVRCARRIGEDRGGFTLLAPLQLAREGDNIYARDLHARDTLLVAQHPGRPLYLLRPMNADEGAPPQFLPLSRDSILREWRGAASVASGMGTAAHGGAGPHASVRAVARQ
ncbi:MAG: hypothetical protein ACT4PJ_02160 [Gemmatimonadaceae bacterium]